MGRAEESPEAIVEAAVLARERFGERARRRKTHAGIFTRPDAREWSRLESIETADSAPARVRVLLPDAEQPR